MTFTSDSEGRSVNDYLKFVDDVIVVIVKDVFLRLFNLLLFYVKLIKDPAAS